MFGFQGDAKEKGEESVLSLVWFSFSHKKKNLSFELHLDKPA